MMSRRGICGNIAAICSTSLGFACLELVERGPEEVGVKKK